MTDLMFNYFQVIKYFLCLVLQLLFGKGSVIFNILLCQWFGEILLNISGDVFVLSVVLSRTEWPALHIGHLAFCTLPVTYRSLGTHSG